MTWLAGRRGSGGRAARGRTGEGTRLRGSGRSVDTAAISGLPGFVVILVDEDQKIVSWNEAAADLFGVPAAQALGQSLADVGGPPRTVTGRGRESPDHHPAAAGWWSGSLLFQREDGSEFLLQATGLRVPPEHGAGILWLAHLHGQDSDQRALREALALAAAEITVLNAADGTVVAP